MPKKLKLNLNDLKVQSFVTALDDEERKRMKGGTGDDCEPSWTDCPSQCLTGCSNCLTTCPSGIPNCMAC